MIAAALMAGLLLGQAGGSSVGAQAPVRDEATRPTTSDPPAEPAVMQDRTGVTDVAGAAAATEWMFGAGVATSVELFHSRTGVRYAVQAVSWARDLTADHGSGILRGRLAWTIEAMPILAEWSPSNVYGFGIAPVGARWNFVPRRRWSAFTELIGGFLGSSAPIPDGLARFNFTAHWGAGVRLPVAPQRGLVIAYRLQHISNGNRLPDNPGVNSHMLFMGFSVIRPR